MTKTMSKKIEDEIHERKQKCCSKKARQNCRDKRIAKEEKERGEKKTKPDRETKEKFCVLQLRQGAYGALPPPAATIAGPLRQGQVMRYCCA
jgi:hypothetical protein